MRINLIDALFNFLDSLLPAGSNVNLKAFVFELTLQNSNVHFLIVNDENFGQDSFSFGTAYNHLVSRRILLIYNATNAACQVTLWFL